MPHVCECTCARLSHAHTFSSCLSFLSVCTSCSLLSPHANISSSFLLSGAPDPRVHNTRCLHKLSERKSRLQDTKMKAKMVFDSLRAAPPKQTIGRESRDVKARVPFFFLRGFSHKANNFTSDCSIYGYIRYRRGPQCVSYSASHTLQQCQAVRHRPGGKERTPHCIINHIYSSVIKVSEYIRLKTTECLGKGILC